MACVTVLVFAYANTELARHWSRPQSVTCHYKIVRIAPPLALRGGQPDDLLAINASLCRLGVKLASPKKIRGARAFFYPCPKAVLLAANLPAAECLVKLTHKGIFTPVHKCKRYSRRNAQTANGQQHSRSNC